MQEPERCLRRRDGDGVRSYYCRKCGRSLFDSDAELGRVRTTCPDRRCKVTQIVFLGGHFASRPVVEQATSRASAL